MSTRIETTLQLARILWQRGLGRWSAEHANWRVLQPDFGDRSVTFHFQNPRARMSVRVEQNIGGPSLASGPRLSVVYRGKEPAPQELFEVAARIIHADRRGTDLEFACWKPSEGKAASLGERVLAQRLELFIVSGCNIDCAFCCENQRNRVPRMMPWPELDRKLLQAAEEGFERIQFMGGEPSLHPRFSEALARAQELGMGTHTITNLLRWEDPAFAKRVAPLLDEIMVSIHAVGEDQGHLVTGSRQWWSRFTKALENLRAFRPARVFCSTVLSTQNESSLEAIAELVLSLQPDLWVMGNPVPVVGSRENGVELGLRLDQQRDLQPRLLALRDRCRAAGTQLIFFCMPHCVLGSELYDQTHEIILADEDRSNAAPSAIDTVNFWSQADYEWNPGAVHLGRIRGDACHGCKRKNDCGGYFSAYFDRWGEDELLPFDPPHVPKQRRFHAFGVGIAKTGSTSIARAFDRYRTRHEFRFTEAVRQIAAWRQGQVDDSEMVRWLSERDASYQLELEVSTFSHFWIRLLPEIFPDARFVCTYRAPLAQVESFLNMMLHNRQRYADAEAFPPWQRTYGELLFDEFDSEVYCSAETIAAKLPELVESYLGYWSRAHRELLTHLPISRTLFVNTVDLDERLTEIAAFLEVPESSLVAAHANRGLYRRRFLDQLDPANLNDRIRVICGAEMAVLFPDLASGV